MMCCMQQNIHWVKKTKHLNEVITKNVTMFPTATILSSINYIAYNQLAKSENQQIYIYFDTYFLYRI